jgi:hypothetical protein
VRPFAFDPGIVEKGVDGTIGVERAFDIGPHLGRFGDVGGNKARLAALLPDDPGGGLAAGRIVIDDDDLGAALGEADSAADPAAGHLSPPLRSPAGIVNHSS